MRTYEEVVCGAILRINVVVTLEDLRSFERWARSVVGPVAVDTEATGLDIYASSWRLRMVQFGTKAEAWVIPVELGPAFMASAQYGLETIPVQVVHNKNYDVPALNAGGLSCATLRAGEDTQILAHLVDPRGRESGGIGMGLKALGVHYLDPSLGDGDAALKLWASGAGVKRDDRFRAAPIDLPELERYAGLDALITAGVYEVLKAKLEGVEHLVPFEHELQLQTLAMSERGLLVDVEYAEALGDYLEMREDVIAQRLDAMGVDNPNSSDQIERMLLADGVELTKRTPKGGAYSVAKDVLEAIDHPSAALITEYRNVTKFKASYVDSCLSLKDRDNRVHPWIRSLKARTARMAVSSPPLHQLPSGDAMIRRMFVAEPGWAVFSADYDQVELRVLAALSREPAMLSAIAAGVDLHSLTAERVGLERKVAKMTNFLIVYGGGATKLAEQARITVEEAKAAIKGYHRAYRGVKRFSNRLQARSKEGGRPVVTASGRRLPLDNDRLYAALNYVVQSTARDVLAEAMLRLAEEGLSEYLWLPIHDEVVGSAPISEVDEVSARVAAVMSTVFEGVELSASAEVFGRSWGHGYGIETLPNELKGFV